MSQENVEIVRAALAAWNTGDTDNLREAMDPNVLVRPWRRPRPRVEHGVHGHLHVA